MSSPFALTTSSTILYTFTLIFIYFSAFQYYSFPNKSCLMPSKLLQTNSLDEQLSVTFQLFIASYAHIIAFLYLLFSQYFTSSFTIPNNCYDKLDAPLLNSDDTMLNFMSLLIFLLSFLSAVSLLKAYSNTNIYSSLTFNI